jgi:hypothetical protein
MQYAYGVTHAAASRHIPSGKMRVPLRVVFRLAIVTQRATHDPATAPRGALIPPKIKHRAAIVDEKQLAGLLRAIEGHDGWRRSRLPCFSLRHRHENGVRHTY